MTAARRDVVVVTGAGGMGDVCARRLGTASTVVLADVDEGRARTSAEAMAGDGFDVLARAVDVSDAASVAALATEAVEHGPLRAVVHTAGLSPTMASAERVLVVDLVGTAVVLEQFEPQVGPGTVGVVIASMAGSMTTIDPERERALASAPVADLMGLADEAALASPGGAYGFAKRANQLRVEAMATPWGRRGARLVSISPGIISTGMGKLELDSEQSGDVMRQMLDMSPVTRIGTADDIAAAVEWLASPAASFVTGTDLRVDGGVTALVRWSFGQ
ncbi:MAG TPA: SDR family oxidoreductase [Acidimicrobiales bacterium]|nr:SDR family oxidoreductase [Acidimicrobiales bacterium]